LAPTTSTRDRIGILFRRTPPARRKLLRLGKRLVSRRHRQVGVDLLVDEPLDLRDLLGGQRLIVREVEARLLAVDERALLVDVVAEHAPQRAS